MRNTIRFIVAMLALCFSVAMHAQTVAQSSTLVLDEKSLEAVNADAVTGLALDPIGKDRSNRPCARIKLHINRMTPEEIGQIEVRTIGGNVLVMKQQLAYEGNGIIIELTARKGTRFYLHHDKFGDSNAVTVDLEANKEYRMEGWNDITLPVTVVCMAQGAEVFLDGVYQGLIGHDHMLTLQGVSAGLHDLRLVLGDDESFKQITVSTELVTFNVELKNKDLLHGTLTFNLNPQNAVLEIDGETLTSEDGVINRRTRYGSYGYTVSAEGYHSIEGTVSIDTTNVVRNIVLKQMITNLTLNAADDVKVWIDGEKVGEGTWKGALAPGSYEIKTKKGAYYPAYSTLTLTPDMDELTMDAPEPTVPYEKNLLVMPVASVYPSMSFGLMLGYVQTVGGYAKFRSNFDFTAGAYNSTSDCNIEGGGYLWPSGEKTETIMNVTGGLLIRAAKFMYPYFGAGYGSRNVLWKDTDGAWVGISDYSFAGLSAEAGVIFKFGPVSLSAGVSNTAFKYTAAEVGLGVMF